MAYILQLTEEDYQWLKKSIYKPKIVAVGEIGLDYHWNDNKEQQIEWFEKQMDIAREAELPIIIHSRDAANETYEVMKANKADEIGGVIHCFSYTKEMAEKCVYQMACEDLNNNEYSNFEEDKKIFENNKDDASIAKMADKYKDGGYYQEAMDIYLELQKKNGTEWAY